MSCSCSTSTCSQDHEIHVGDYGIVFRTTVNDQDCNAVDISSATAITFIFEKPTGETFDRTGSFTTDGTDGQIEYTLQDGDIAVSGSWRLQIKLEFTNGLWYTNIYEFRVFKNVG